MASSSLALQPAPVGGGDVRADLPGERDHCPIHLRTTNPIESTFATVRLRTKVTKGHGSRAAGLAMAFKLIESAQRRWRMVNAPHLVTLVRAGATFAGGNLIERPDHQQPAANSASPTAAQQVAARAA
jgi:hypothetical protein